MIVYIDAEYKCYVSDDGTMRAVESDFFDGMTDEVIEGYRYIPDGEVWVREDGIEFVGEMIAPHKDYVELQGKQLIYEQEQRKELSTDLNERVTAVETDVNDLNAAMTALLTGEGMI